MSPFYTKILILTCLCLITINFLYIRQCLIVPEIFDESESHDFGQIRQHGDYWVWHNYLRAELNFNHTESITLTTHGTFQDLGMLSMLVHRWRGPISLTLYANDEDFEKTIESLGYISACLKGGQLLQRYVTIHLCFHQRHIPAALMHSSFHRTPSPLVCYFGALFIDGTQADTFWYQNKLPYPVNLLRNVARLNARTHFVMPLDMDLLPTPDFPVEFLKFKARESELRYLPKKSIYCLTTFVHDYVSPLPIDTLQLLYVLSKTNISKAKNYDNPLRQSVWLQSVRMQQHISLYGISNVNDMCVGYVTDNELEPLYDERFVMESIYETPNNIQSRVLNYLDFTFINLAGTFLFQRANNSWHNVNTSYMFNTKRRQERSFGADFLYFHGVEKTNNETKVDETSEEEEE